MAKGDGDYRRRLPAMTELSASLEPDVVTLREVFAVPEGALS